MRGPQRGGPVQGLGLRAGAGGCGRLLPDARRERDERAQPLLPPLLCQQAWRPPTQLPARPPWANPHPPPSRLTLRRSSYAMTSSAPRARCAVRAGLPPLPARASAWPPPPLAAQRMLRASSRLQKLQSPLRQPARTCSTHSTAPSCQSCSGGRSTAACRLKLVVHGLPAPSAHAAPPPAPRLSDMIDIQ